MPDNPTTEEINARFSAMDDSVNLINATVAEDIEALTNNLFDSRGVLIRCVAFETAEEVKLMVTRNTAHLETQLGKDWAIADDRSKTAYTDAITTGKAYVG